MLRVFGSLVATSMIGVIAAAAPASRISRAIDPGASVLVAGNLHPAISGATDLGALDPSTPMHNIILIVKPSAEQQAELDRLLADQQNPSSSKYHQWLTPEQFGGRFGLSTSDHSKIVQWLKSQNLAVEQTARARNWFAFSGTAGQVSHAFQTPIHRFSVNGSTHFANIAEPSVPAALDGIAGGFLGLNDFYPVSTFHLAQPDFTSGTAHYLSPQDFATIYDLNPLYQAGFDGTGQSIAIVGAADLPLADVRAFRQRYGLPANDPQPILFGVDPGGISGETNLDVEWAGAVAPHATIYYVYASSPFTALIDAIDLNIAPVISSSYYTCEGDASPIFYRSLLQQGNAQGITILSAAGDGGAAGCFDQFDLFATHGELLQFPSSTPEVTGVGGTQFNEGTGQYWSATNSATFGSVLSYIPETAWNESIEGDIIAAGGGGPSAIFSKPAWQQGPGVPNDNARDVPDIAMSAAGHDAYLIVYSGSNEITYGTSAASPATSGIIAILNQYQVAKGYQKAPGLGNINPQLYRLAQAAPTAFHDIVTGNNAVPCTQGSPNCVTGVYGFAAGPGYDMATGLGSLDANNFVTQFNTATRGVTVTMFSSVKTATLNDTLAFSAVVAAANGSGIPTGVVDFSVGTLALGSVAMTTRNGAGEADITIPAYLFGGTGAFTLYAQYEGDSTFSGGGGRIGVTLTAPTGVSAIIPGVATNPVYPVFDPTTGLSWQETVRLREAAGVASILTGFTIDGQAQNLAQYFPAPQIPPNTTISSNPVLFQNLSTYPVTKTFGFTGVDVNGQAWSRQITALFVGPETLDAGFQPTLVPVTIVQDPTADPSCQWSQQVFVDEEIGYSALVTTLYQGAINMASEIPAIFGTTRLQAWGSLSGTLCWSGVTPGTTDTVEIGLSYGASNLQVNFAGAVANPVKITASSKSITLAAPDAKTPASATLGVTLSDKTQNWIATVFPTNTATSWLKAGPLAGTGTGTITLTASGAGFEPGVYRATVVIQSPNALPATVNVPVMFVYGPTSSGMTITGAASAATFRGAASPGMLLSVFGTQLAPAANSASSIPLPFSLNGVSARVNGLDAPILYVSPGQLNIQVPFEAGSGPAVLGVNNNGTLAGFQLQIAPAAPGIFADSSNNLVPSSTVKAGGTGTLFFTGDGDVTPALLTGFTPASTTPVASLPKSRLPVSITVGGVPAFIDFYGIPSGLVGVSQVNFTVPGTVPSGKQPVVVTVGGASSPPVNLTIQ